MSSCCSTGKTPCTCEQELRLYRKLALCLHTALQCTAQHMYSTALHCTALHCTALHCTALHCTALHSFIMAGLHQLMTLWPDPLPMTHAWLMLAYCTIAGQGSSFLATPQTAGHNQVPSNFERRQKHRGQTRVRNGVEVVSRNTQCRKGECTIAMMSCGTACGASVHT